MAHITEFRIDGLLGRQKPIHIILNRGVNVFFGENGSGKTTLLKILDAALSRNGEEMQRLPVERAEVDIYVISEKRVIKHIWERRDAKSISFSERQRDSIDSEYIESSDGKYLLFERALPEVDWKLTPSRRKKNIQGKGWAHTFMPTTRLYFGDVALGRFGVSRSNLSEKELDQAFAESVNRAWLQFYSQTLNEVRHIQEAGLRTVLRQVLNPTIDRTSESQSDSSAVYQRVGRFLERQSESNEISLGSLADFRRRYKLDADLRRIIDNLDNVEKKIEKAMIPVDSFLSTINTLFSRGKSLTLSDNELQVLLADGRNLSISGLSSGEKHLIKILLAAMTSGPNSVLIDEPELSMHIDWQRIFTRTILSLNPECQLIVASHSPEVMAEIDDSNIFKL